MKIILLRNPKYVLNNNYGWFTGYRVIPAIVEGIYNQKEEQLFTSICFKEIKDFKTAYKKAQCEVKKYLNENHSFTKKRKM